MNDRDEREEIVFEAALQLPPGERAEYLDKACPHDPELRRRVEGLLGALDRAGALLMEPAVSARTRTLEPSLAATDHAGDKVGRYKLLQRIGEGGCGVVYMAEQEEPVQRRVALKIIKLGMDTKSVVARFEAERQALAMMDHPNIAKFFDAGVTETGRPYFVMELVRGIRITDYCDQNDLDTTARLDLFIQVCRAVQHAHQKGIIHRDLKPSNILVTLHDGVPVPKVIDFGIAKAIQGRLTDQTLFTAFEQFIGTPAYMSPEQAELSGLDIDTRSDIYSLGVLLYELLTGKTPFDPKELLASGLDKMRQTIREQEPVRPSTCLSTMVGVELARAAKHRRIEAQRLVNLLSGDLDWIVMRCLEKDRTRRYETANGVAMDIKRHLNHEPVNARPPSAMYRLQKAWRRNKLVFIAGSAVVLAILAGAGLSLWQALRATRAERTATAEATRTVQALGVATKKTRLAEAERERAEQERLAAQRHLYVATCNLAQAAWNENNVQRMKQLLEESSSYPDRGFEWFYWQRQAHLELRAFWGHTSFLRGVAFSPDSQRIVSGSADATAKVWDAQSGFELLTLKGHRSEVATVAFFPDGRRIVTGSWDQTAKVWDAVSGNEQLTLTGHLAVIPPSRFRKMAVGL
jgi:serine/threonine protein kinase